MRCPLKATLVIVSLVLLAGVLAPDVANTDPPPNPPPCIRLDTLFCIRLSDSRRDTVDLDKWQFEFEFVNWTGRDAEGIVISLNVARTGSGVVQPGSPFISGASIDADGRPIVGPASPPSGNLGTTNDWTGVLLSGDNPPTFTQVRFSKGTGTALAHPVAIGTTGGVPTIFDGLLDPKFEAPTTEPECVAAHIAMIPGAIDKGGSPPLVGPSNIESADDGFNILDGFVVEVDDWNAGEEVSFNWNLIDGAGNTIGYLNTAGSVEGDEYGFGVWNLAQLASPAPVPLFNQNTGYDPPDASNPNQDSPNFWAEDQDSNGVDTFPINPIPPGKPGANTFFAVEFGAAVTAPFVDGSNNNNFVFDGLAVTSGANMLSLFADVATGALADAGFGAGVAWIDYDDDGDQDLFVSNGLGGGNKLFRNDGNDVFTDVTSGQLVGSSFASTWGDYDNDGELDVFLAQNPNTLLRNDGGVFNFVLILFLLGPLPGQGVAWADYDNDGDLDLYLALGAFGGGSNFLIRNDGADVFTDATSFPLGDAGLGVGVAWGDYDNDGDQDIYLANNGQDNKLFRNDGGGAFADVTSGPLQGSGFTTAAAWGDYDHDNDLDLYVVENGATNTLLRNDGGGVFTDVTGGPLGGPGLGLGVAWGDYDNDGRLDLYLSNNGRANTLLRNDGGGAFTETTHGPLGDAGFGAGVAWADYDGDGDLDLYLANESQANKLLQNNPLPGNNNHWLHLDLEGVQSNRSAIGARVRVVAGGVGQIREVSGGSGYLSQNSLTAEFGLGPVTIVDSVKVIWPSGLTEVMLNVAVDTLFTFLEGSGTVVPGIGDPPPGIPKRFALHQNAPNPFNPETTIQYDVPSRGGAVTLRVYDVSGRLVRTLVDGPQTPGEKRVVWNGTSDRGSGVATGVYFYRLTAPGFVSTRKLVFLK